jgi:hypothetical protein
MLFATLQIYAVLASVFSLSTSGTPALGSYNIADDITISGLSSGAFMAVQVISINGFCFYFFPNPVIFPF